MQTFKPENGKDYKNLSCTALYRAFSDNKTVTGFVTKIDAENETIKVHLGSGHMALLPFSEASIYDFTYNSRSPLPVQIYTLLNKHIQVKITQFESEPGVILVSRKQNMRIAYDYFLKLPKYSQVRGIVVSNTDTTAFMDIGAGIVGTVHINEACVFRASNISDFLPKGTIANVKKLDVGENSYFILSNKELDREDLKDYLGKTFTAIVDAPVVNTNINGYFVHITPQLKGIMDAPKGIYLPEGAEVKVLVHNYSRRGLKLVLKEIL